MAKQSKGIMLVGKFTKTQLTTSLTDALDEIANLAVSRNQCRQENTALKAEVVELNNRNYHLTIQLAAMTDKYEIVKHQHRQLTNDVGFVSDAMRYTLGATPFVSTNTCIEKCIINTTFMQRIFAFFGL